MSAITIIATYWYLLLILFTYWYRWFTLFIYVPQAISCITTRHIATLRYDYIIDIIFIIIDVFRCMPASLRHISHW